MQEVLALLDDAVAPAAPALRAPEVGGMAIGSGAPSYRTCEAESGLPPDLPLVLLAYRGRDALVGMPPFVLQPCSSPPRGMPPLSRLVWPPACPLQVCRPSICSEASDMASLRSSAPTL